MAWHIPIENLGSASYLDALGFLGVVFQLRNGTFCWIDMQKVRVNENRHGQCLALGSLIGYDWLMASIISLDCFLGDFHSLGIFQLSHMLLESCLNSQVYSFISLSRKKNLIHGSRSVKSWRSTGTTIGANPNGKWQPPQFSLIRSFPARVDITIN